MGTQLRAIRPAVTHIQFRALDWHDKGFVSHGTGLSNFPVQVHHVGASSSLVKVVHVLRDDVDIEDPLQPRKRMVPLVG